MKPPAVLRLPDKTLGAPQVSAFASLTVLNTCINSPSLVYFQFSMLYKLLMDFVFPVPSVTL